MGYKKRTSRILESARTRASGIAGFDPNLDLGGGLSLAKLKEAARQRGIARVSRMKATLCACGCRGVVRRRRRTSHRMINLYSCH